ncbi:MAG: flagellar type III secretion system pore protein FliP [Proteobacteria bacterium]|nr:flagellar type III secretion system pore protein FliP [Pseudomonadota bacterium]
MIGLLPILDGVVDPVATAAQTVQQASGHAPGGLGAVGMVVVLTVVTLLPAIVLSCTSFVRFIVVLGFVRTGLGTPAAPPNQVLVGLALFMTVFVSGPIAEKMYDAAGRDYLDGKLTEAQAFEKATPPLRDFLLARTTDADLELFYSVSSGHRPTTLADVPLRIAVPAFMLSELRTAFTIGLTVLLPFLVIDLVAATILTSLGMVMVPPSSVALPLKLLVFVMIDGWHLIVESLLRGAAT